MSPQVLVRVYEGRTQSDAAVTFAADAARLAKDGWTPISQSWADGRAGVRRLLAFGAEIAGTIRPDGTLTVTYRREANQQVSINIPTPAPVATAAATKVCPDCAETVQAAARICRYCRYEFGTAPVTAASTDPQPTATDRWTDRLATGEPWVEMGTHGLRGRWFVAGPPGRHLGEQEDVSFANGMIERSSVDRRYTYFYHPAEVSLAGRPGEALILDHRRVPVVWWSKTPVASPPPAGSVDPQRAEPWARARAGGTWLPAQPSIFVGRWRVEAAGWDEPMPGLLVLLRVDDGSVVIRTADDRPLRTLPVHEALFARRDGDDGAELLLMDQARKPLLHLVAA